MANYTSEATNMDNIEKLFNEISASIFTIEPVYSYDELPEKFIELCNMITQTETDECFWSMGEYSHCAIGDLIVGAYWHFVHWHGGQSSLSYAALCALGGIFEPGMSSEPEEGAPEYDAYRMLDQTASEAKAR